MSTCDHRLHGDGLPCVNTAQHPGQDDDTGRGCVHEASSGSWVNDTHQDGGHG